MRILISLYNAGGLSGFNLINIGLSPTYKNATRLY